MPLSETLKFKSASSIHICLSIDCNWWEIQNFINIKARPEMTSKHRKIEETDKIHVNWWKMGILRI